MSELEELIIKMLYFVFVCIIAFKIIGISDAVSILFYLTFILVFFLWILLLRKITKMDLLCMLVITTAIFNVLISTLICDCNITFEYFNKLLMFSTTIIYLQIVSKVYVSTKTQKNILTLMDGITIFMIFVYFFQKDYMYMFEGKISNYLTFNFSNPNLTGLFVLYIAILYLIRMSETKNMKCKSIYFLFCSIMFFYVVKTRARNCIIGLLLFVAIYLLKKIHVKEMYRIKSIWAIIYSTFPLVFAIAYLVLIKNSFVNNVFGFLVSEGKKLNSREKIWTYALEVIEKNPIIGAYADISGKSHMHNSHLDIIASYGIVTMVLVCVFLFNIIWKNGKVYTEKRNILYMYGFIVTIIMGIGEAALFSGGLGIYLLSGLLLLQSNCPCNQIVNS